MLKTIALCETLGKAISFWHQLAQLEGVQLKLLISNNAQIHSLRFLFWVFRSFIHFKPRSQLLILKLLLGGRLLISFKGLHHAHTLSLIRKELPDIGLHAAGVIYRKTLLDCFRLGVLNPHIGLLPDYRGRSVMEWSILHGKPTGITTFFIDEGIDTGPHIVMRRVIDVSQFGDIDSAKNHLFSLDSDMFAEALQILQKPDYTPTYQNKEEGKRYYVMSGLFRDVISQLMALD